LKLWNYFQS